MPAGSWQLSRAACDAAVSSQSDLVAVLPERHCHWWRRSAPAAAFQARQGALCPGVHFDELLSFTCISLKSA